VRDTVTVEKFRKPSIAAIAEEFVSHGENLARFLEHANLKFLIFPYPMEARGDAEILALAEQYYPKFLALIGVRR
jgi:hypothetical protein